jgi:hypothetical protein
MKKEYVVKSIDAAPDGKPYVLVSLMSAKELMNNSSSVSPFGSKVMGFSNMNDMVKELNKMFTGMGGIPGGITAIKLNMHEYKEMNLSVGDKVYLEITKAENIGV